MTATPHTESSRAAAMATVERAFSCRVTYVRDGVLVKEDAPDYDDGDEAYDVDREDAFKRGMYGEDA